MKRCRAIHDFTGFQILRCALQAGHKGNHKPERYEPCTEEQYEALLKAAS